MGANRTKRPNVLITQFGDGYEARFPVGINTNKSRWSVSFTYPDAVAAAICDFLDARGGHEAFRWTDPRGKVSDFKCAEWSDRREGQGVVRISAEFQEVFEP